MSDCLLATEWFEDMENAGGGVRRPAQRPIGFIPPPVL